MLMIYLLLTVLQVVFMMAGGVLIFESVCHSFATVATGGFSTRNNSIAAFSPYVQYVVMVFMVLAGTNFIVHYFMLRGQTRKALKDEELRFYWFVIIVTGLLVSGMLLFKMHLPAEKAFRDGFFQVISIITSTGFATADYLLWPGFATTIMFALLFVGGSTGSTSGGIKMARHLLVLKNIKSTLHKTFSPNLVSVIKLNGQEIPMNRNVTILTFVLLYLFIFLISTIAMTFMGIDPETSAGSVATVMGGIGPGLGSVGPAGNFAHLPEMAKVLLSFLMIVGRLEIFTILAIFMPLFWKE
ncbi:MAG: potassium transporter TrkG [Bacteroidales bacterium]